MDDRDTEHEKSLTTIRPEHFGTGAFFFAAALMEGLVKKGVLSKTDAQEIIQDALDKVRAGTVPEITGASDIFRHFYGYQTF